MQVGYIRDIGETAEVSCRLSRFAGSVAMTTVREHLRP